MNMHDVYNYYLNQDNHELIIYEGNAVLATILDVRTVEQAQQLFGDVVWELREVDVLL